MGTFGGDLLRMLARGVIETGANAGNTMLTNYLKSGMEVKEAYGKQLLDVLGTQSDPESLRAAQEQLKSFGVSVPNVNRTNPAGVEVTSPSGAQLTAPRSMALSELAPGMNPVTGPLRLTPTFDKARAAALSSLPMETQQGILTKDPERELKLLMEAGRIQDKTLTRDQRAYDNEQNRVNQANIAADRTAMYGLLAQNNQDLKRQSLSQSLANQKLTHGIMGDKLEAGARTQLDKALVNLEKVTKDPMATEEQIKTAIEQYNGMHGSIVAKHPDLGNYFQPLEPELSKGWFGTSMGAGKVTGAKTKASGEKAPAAKQEVAPSVMTFPRRVKVKGQETIVNSQEEYDALQKGLQK